MLSMKRDLLQIRGEGDSTNVTSQCEELAMLSNDHSRIHPMLRDRN